MHPDPWTLLRRAWLGADAVGHWLLFLQGLKTELNTYRRKMKTGSMLVPVQSVLSNILQGSGNTLVGWGWGVPA